MAKPVKQTPEEMKALFDDAVQRALDKHLDERRRHGLPEFNPRPGETFTLRGYDGECMVVAIARDPLGVPQLVWLDGDRMFHTRDLEVMGALLWSDDKPPARVPRYEALYAQAKATP